MARLTIDPGSLQCPDFSLAEWEATRNDVVAADPNTSQAHAAIILAISWKATNNAEKRAWEAQQIADQQEEQAREDQRVADETAEREDREKRKADAVDEERKKYKTKFLPIPARPLTSSLSIHTIAPTARAALKKGDYVELYWFTPIGMREALSKPNRMLEAASIGQDEDGNLTFTSKAAIEAAKGLVQDEDLSIEQLCLAAPIFIEQAGLAGWPEDRLQMLVQFWDNIQNHPWRWHHDPVRMRALMRYQGEQRRRWHVAIQAIGQGYSIAVINEDILLDTFNELYHEERVAADAIRTAHLIRTSFYPRNKHSHANKHILPQYLHSLIYMVFYTYACPCVALPAVLLAHVHLGTINHSRNPCCVSTRTKRAAF